MINTMEYVYNLSFIHDKFKLALAHAYRVPRLHSSLMTFSFP